MGLIPQEHALADRGHLCGHERGYGQKIDFTCNKGHIGALWRVSIDDRYGKAEGDAHRPSRQAA